MKNKLCKNNDGREIHIKKVQLCRKCYGKLLKEKNTKICKIDGCNRKAHVLGLCSRHYDRQRQGITDMSPEPLSLKWKDDDPRRFKNIGCMVNSCNARHYAKGHCHKHWILNKKYGIPIYKKDFPKPICKVTDCLKISIGEHGFCRFHYVRFKNGTNLTRPKGRGNKGKSNYKWKGGISSYPNHHRLKKNRLIVLEKNNWTCKYCGGKADRVHHRDKTNNNHEINNLAPSCAKCNSDRMSEDRRYFIRDYGISCKKIAEEFNLTKNEVVFLHDNGKLRGIVNQTDFMG